jgi:hypothetical protein
MIPFDIGEHNRLVMSRLAPVLERERARLPVEVAQRWGIDVDETMITVGAALADDLDDDGTLWMTVWVNGTGEQWFAVDARAVGILDIGGQAYIVPPEDEPPD